MPGLTSEQITFFEDNGYLIVENVLDADSLTAVEDEYSSILDREVPRLAAEGKVTETYDGMPFAERYPRILPQLQHMYDLYEHLDITLPLMHDVPSDAGINTGPAVFSHVLRNPAILDIAESLMGPELSCSPVQHARIKPPKQVMDGLAVDSNVAKTSWHQDEAVLNDQATDISMLTVWVAVTDATVENGCMVCVPGSHKGDLEVIMHCPGKSIGSAEIYIPADLVGSNAVPMPVGKGGVVLLHQRTKHGSLENKTDRIRWSFDLRYYVTGANSGREVFPSFVARSARDPGLELRDPDVYAANWKAARSYLSSLDRVEFNNRWKRYSDHPLCA